MQNGGQIASTTSYTPPYAYTVLPVAPKCATPARAAASDNQYYWAVGAGVAAAAALVGGGGGDDKPSSP